MSTFILSTCSIADLSIAHMEKRNIPFACFHYTMDGKECIDDMGASIASADFYQAMVDGAEVKTAQVNVEEYTNYFTPYLEQGMDILHLTLSSGLSGSYNSARIAAEMLAEKYPDRKLYIVDSLGASAGTGLMVDTLADMRDAGKTIDECYAWIEEHKLEMHHWFCSTDLTFYVKGGRVTKAAGWFGTVLKICPVLNVDSLGRLIPRFKVRGKQKALKELANQMEEHAQNGTDYSGKCFISHSNCLEDALPVKAEIESRFPHLNGQVEIFNIGTTIGCHSGPGTVAVFFWGDRRPAE